MVEIGEIESFVNENIVIFHQKKIDSLKKLKLKKVLKRKNPYLFKAKNILTAHDLVKTLLDAHLSSQEEAMFGDFLEKLAIFICGKVFGGRKSSAEGIDLEFTKKDVKYIVSIKSGPNWGNSSQINRMINNFDKAKRILRSNAPDRNIIAINGCCYGKNKVQDKGTYFKLCGQKFWTLISDHEKLYLDIIEPIGYKAKEKTDDFTKEYSKLINLFTVEFSNDYCKNGVIDWEKIVKFNSGSN